MSEANDAEGTLDLRRHGGGRRKAVWLALAALVALAVVAGIYLMRGGGKGESAQGYVTQEVTKGMLDVTVTGTGTLEPVTKVDISSELSGIVDEVSADFNDKVKAGQKLARLNTATLEAQVIKARATLESAKAQLAQAKATLTESEAQLQKVQKSRELSGGKVPSQHELDTAQASYERAQAGVVTAHAQIDEAQAALTVSETSLSKAVIRSPIDGVVLNRAVEPGQTVASSLQAPVLFTIAETLTQMELHVFIDEADVGEIRQGQKATFTVDAYPDKTFEAKITEVRFTPTVTEGVVTYETVLSVDNSGLSLRPGMTATATVTTQHLEDVLLVPNASRRFAPKQAAAADGGSFVDKLLPRPRHPKANRDSKGPRVWVMTQDKKQPLKPVSIKAGPSDGNLTVVFEGEIKPGDEVVVGMETTGK